MAGHMIIGLGFDVLRPVGRGEGEVPRGQGGGCVRHRAGQLPLSRTLLTLTLTLTLLQASCVSLDAYDAFGPVMWDVYK